ncbi:MAG: hypothetical protein FWE48_02390 [Coriobacteriia bacterium]|nr:hypothetical protein [Coriobacteriia bacterium]
MSQVSNYLDMLTHEIGPRPAASDTERQTAEWLQDQFNEAGVAAELHDFDAPRTPESARIFTYLIAPIATFGIGASFLEQMWVIHWACWLALAALSVLTLLDLYGSKGPKGLVALLPKNPSQNVVAKSVPSTYAPGEMPKRVVLVANYDSALTSPLMSESTISIHRLLQTLANGVVLALPLLTLSLILNIRLLLPITTQIFYVLLVLCVPGVILLINRLIARVMNRYSPGANNNASGIAAMLFAMNKFNESQQGQSSHAAATAAVKLAAAEAKAAKAAMQSSKMPGIDYRPPQTSSSSSSLESTADDLSSDETSPATESLKNVEADVGAEDTSIPAPTADSNTTNVSAPVSRERFAEFETVEFSKLGSESMVEVSSSYAALDDYDAETTFSDEPAPARGNEVLDASVIGAPAPVKSVGVRAEPSAIDSPRSADRSKSSNKENRKPKSSRVKGSTRPKKSLFSFGKNRHDSHDDDPSNWLGLDDDFNARKEGKAIGSWDNFGEGAGMLEEGVVDLTDSFAPMGGQANTEQQDSVSQADSFPETDDDFLSDEIASLSDSFAPLAGPGEGEDDDGFAWKGGFAGDDPIEDDAYASAEAARIRRKVLDSLDVELKEKEVWFVATGAHYAERAGIRAFMEDYGDQLRGALFINISAVGSGDLYWSTKEKFGKARPSSARLTSMLRRLSRESQVRIKPWKKQALVSDAGPILAAGRKAITLTRLTEKGIPFAFASAQDTAARLDSNNIEEAADIVCSIIREA